MVGGYYAGLTITGGLLGSIAGAGLSGGTAYSVIKNKKNKNHSIQNQNMNQSNKTKNKED